MSIEYLTAKEKQMYEVIGAITESNIPVIFKGAMVTKLILREKNFNDFSRETRDIDVSWVDETPPMSRLTDMLNRALSPIGFNVIATREYGEKMSACYDVFEAASGELSMTIDIDMRPAASSREYHYGGITFKGVTPDSVISDKINAISSDRVFRRAKDLIDLYALAQCVSISLESIYNVLAQENRIIGSFNAFLNRKNDLQHSYERLRRMDIKPEFEVVYNYLTRFLSPFIYSVTATLVWDNLNKNWVS